MIADKINECSDFILTTWKGQKLANTDGFFDKSDPFLRFKRIKNDTTSILVYETEIVKDNLNPLWKACELSLAKLC